MRWTIGISGLLAVAFGFTWATKGWLGYPLGFFGSAITVGIGIAMVGGSVVDVWRR
jgi:hypothetical protein